MGLFLSAKCDGCWERIENCDCGNYRNGTLTKNGRGENVSHITRGRPLEEDDYCMNCHQLHYDCQCVHQTTGRKKKMTKHFSDEYTLTEGSTRGGMSPKKRKPLSKKKVLAAVRKVKADREGVIKDVCLKCRSWTNNKAHGKYKCYCGDCPAKQRDDTPKEQKIRNHTAGPVWRQVKVDKPFCPVCNSEMKRTKGDAATMFDWECSSFRCNYHC